MNYFNFHKRKEILLTFSLAKKRIFMDTQKYSLNIHLKEELTDLLWKFPGIPYPYRQSKRRMVNTVLMVNITPICKNDLEDKSMLFIHFYLTQRHKLKTWFVSVASREYFGVEPFYLHIHLQSILLLGIVKILVSLPLLIKLITGQSLHLVLIFAN